MSGVDPHVVTRGLGLVNFAEFDWYQATFHDTSPDVLLSFLQARYEQSDLVPARAKNGYEQAATIKRGDTELLTAMWGGNTGINVKATGDNSPEAAVYLRRFGPHNVTRADACVDYSDAGMFDAVSSRLMRFAVGKGIKINQQGDWKRGEARTLYLGSRSSAVQLVMYEKGYQVGSSDLDWVRLEVRVYPKKEKRLAASTLEPLQLFGTTWVADAMRACKLLDCNRIKLGTVYKPTDTERAKKALCIQYKNVIKQWVEQAGSPDAFAVELLQLIDQVEKDLAPREIPRAAATKP